MATTTPLVNNYESQIVFSNQSDDVYFNLYKSRMTFRLKITGLANNVGSSSKDI